MADDESRGYADAVEEQLQRILASRFFAQAPQQSKLVLFLVRAYLDNPDQDFKETSIGMAVFGRRPGYDNAKDPIVRVTGARLRQRLREFYASELAATARWTIDLPDNGYRPVITQRIAAAATKENETATSSFSWDRLLAMVHRHPVSAVVAGLLVTLALWSGARAARAGLVTSANRQGLRVVEVTHDGNPKRGPISVLGNRVYFRELEDGLETLAWANVGPDSSVHALNVPPSLSVLDTRLPGPDLLVARSSPGAAGILTNNGTLRWLVHAEPTCGAWVGRESFVIGTTNGLILANAASIQSVLVPQVIVSDVAWNRRRGVLRFTRYDSALNHSSIWETSLDSGPPKALAQYPPDSREGAWDAQERLFAFVATKRVSSDIWVDSEGLWGSERTRITDSSMDFHWPRLLEPGRLLALASKHDAHLMQYDPKSHQFRNFLFGQPLKELDFTRNYKALAYVTYPERELWKSGAKGEDSRRIYAGPLQVIEPRWSPDGASIAFIGAEPQGGEHIYLIPSEGGAPVRATNRIESEGVPTWSPDGSTIVFGDLHQGSANIKKIHMVDVRSKIVSKLPDSEGLWSPRWSPDGRYIAALSYDFKAIRLFDWQQQRWQERDLVRFDNMDNLRWSPGSETLFFTNFAPRDRRHHGLPLAGMYKVDLGTRRVVLVADLDGYPPNDQSWFGVTPEGVPLQTWTDVTQEVYLIEYAR